MKSEELARSIAALLADKKGLNITVLDLRKESTYTDFLVIASGTSDRHVQALCQHVMDELRDEGVRPIGSEGLRDGQWGLVDYGSVVCHVFHQFTRELYALEQLWTKAQKLSIEPSAAIGGAG